VIRAGLALLAILATLGGCTAAAPATCSTAGMEPQPQLTCEMAVGAARERLATMGGVTGIEVRYGGFCPPGGRCAPFGDDLTTARVFVERAAAAHPLMLIVSLRPDGTVEASEAAPMPAPSTVPEG
jgi:hypothetical protein